VATIDSRVRRPRSRRPSRSSSVIVGDKVARSFVL
jgi:hypothetical protein